MDATLKQKESQGFQLIELVIVLALLGLITAFAVPDLLRATAAQRVRLAAGEIAGIFQRGRMEAIRRGGNVAVKFRDQDDGTYTYTLYRDGDADGVLNQDIDLGIDSALSQPRRLEQVGGNVGFGLPTAFVPRDPANPRRRLDHLEDPIRFNRSDLASFGPLGTATPGTVYITDHQDHLAAVRLLGPTGRVQVLYYDPDLDQWSRR
ncbi:MAG TPA: GspH/FimT family pseudopilin [Thermoanaerobaculia bacterium]|nr:GspH/FimT family pseudopilin [Thermoanaerobaculia bacterium]